MKLAAAVYFGLKVVAWVSSAGECVIQNAIGFGSSFA